jgi:hypothetical protein
MLRILTQHLQSFGRLQSSTSSPTTSRWENHFKATLWQRSVHNDHLINNLAVIYQQLDEKETARKFFQQLLSTLMFLVDCGEMQASQFDGFLINANPSVLSSSGRSSRIDGYANPNKELSTVSKM